MLRAFDASVNSNNGEIAKLNVIMLCGKNDKSIRYARLILICLSAKASIVIIPIAKRDIGKNHLNKNITYVHASALASPDFTQKLIKNTKAIPICSKNNPVRVTEKNFLISLDANALKNMAKYSRQIIE